jgi:hypothetical protein
MQLHGSLSGIVVLRDLYGAQTEDRTPSAARAPVRHTDCGLLISLRTLQHEFHAAAPWMMVAPVLGLRGNGGDPLRSTNRGRTSAISGSRPLTFHQDRFYRESAASACSGCLGFRQVVPLAQAASEHGKASILAHRLLSARLRGPRLYCRSDDTTFLQLIFRSHGRANPDPRLQERNT